MSDQQEDNAKATEVSETATAESKGDVKETKEDENDPYAYLDREFTTEKFKIEIRNMPKYYGLQQLRHLFNDTLSLNAGKIKIPKKHSRYIFVCFRSEECRDKAIAALHKYKWRGNMLTAFKAKPSQDPLVRKRILETEGADGNGKRSKVDDGRSAEDAIQDSTIPLWNMPYEEQLEKKQKDAQKLMKTLGQMLKKSNPRLEDWLTKQEKLNDGMPCPLLDVRHSKNIDGYRNKCEFTIGINKDTGLKTVGFRTGSYMNGVTGVGSIYHLKHISDNVKDAVKILETYVRKSDLEVYNPENLQGNFRQLVVREAQGELMLIVGVYPKGMSQEREESLKADLIELFSGVKSLYYQHVVKKSASGDDGPKAQHLHGDEYVHYKLFDLSFRISPEAFFQINTEVAEIMYKSAMEMLGPMDGSSVLDICCGTGSIGLSFAKHCNEVLGVEENAQAVKDAEHNAKANNVSNAQFFCGKAEEILFSLYKRASNPDVIAVVDPPRAGLHNKGINTIRNINEIKKLVYMSCSPTQAMKNFIDLGRQTSKTMHGHPFVPVKAVPVDMFPYTNHYELVIFFRRFDSLEENSSSVPDKVLDLTAPSSVQIVR